MTTLSAPVRLRRGLSATAATNNILLQPGEPAFELDTGRFKICGDVATHFNDLPYVDGQVIPAYRFKGYDPSGVTDSDTALAKAFAELGDDIGIVDLGYGTWKTGINAVLDRPGQGLIGLGYGACTVDFRGTGTFLEAWDSTVPVPVDGAGTSPGSAGPISGFEISAANNANANIIGINQHDLSRIRTDVLITDFDNTGAIGFLSRATRTWQERADMVLHTRNCTDAVVLTRSDDHPLGEVSWDYAAHIYVSVEAHGQNQNGVSLLKSCEMLGAHLKIDGNCAAYATNTGVFFTVGIGAGDGSGFKGHLELSAETGNSLLACHDINVGSDAGAYIEAEGGISFNGSAFQAGTAVWTGSKVRFNGPVKCPSLLNGSGYNAVTNPVVPNGFFYDKNTNRSLLLDPAATAVNYPILGSGNSGQRPYIGAGGPDASLGLWLNGPLLISGLTAVTKDAQSNIAADAFIPGLTSTPTAAGTTTLTVDSTQVQEFTGSTTQTVVLPTTSIVAGRRFTINNLSTGFVTVNSSAGNLIANVAPGHQMIVTSRQVTPTTNVHWVFQYTASVIIRDTAVASAVAVRDANGNLLADNFIAGATSTTTAGGTTALTVDSTHTQVFTGSTTHTVTMPTTGIVAGQCYVIVNSSTGFVTVNSSAGNLIVNVAPNHQLTLTALQSTPTAQFHWAGQYTTTLPARDTAVAGSAALRDAQGNLLADAFIPGLASTATSGGTTALDVDSKEIQVFTGSTTHTVTMPTTGIVAGQRYTIVNLSTGPVTVQSSGASTMTVLPPNVSGTFIASIDTPTTAANWIALATRDANGNIIADAFVPGFTSTPTAAGTTALTADSTEVQVFTGTALHTVLLPTTGIVAGQRYTVVNQSTNSVTVQSSGANTVVGLGGSGFGACNAVFIALQAAPTTAAHWAYMFGPSAAMSSNPNVLSIAQRNAQGNLRADAFIPSLSTTPTAAGTTALTVDSTQKQVFTGSTTQTVTLPTTSLVDGHTIEIINTSSSAVTINSSAGNLVKTLAAGASTVATALVPTPTTAANWFATA